MNSHVVALFWRNVDKRGDDECWPWMSWRRQKAWTTYGRITVIENGVRKNLAAHRVSALIHLGPPPAPDAVVMHTCDNPPCVNPMHLRYGTVKDNAVDAVEKGSMRGWRTRQALCEFGHPYGSTVRKRGSRRCLICERKAAARRRDRLRAEGLCIRCGDKPQIPHVLCESCIERERLRKLRARAASERKEGAS